MRRRLFAYLESALVVAVAALVAGAVNQLFLLPHVTVLLLAAVLFSAFRWGLGPSLFAALCSVALSSYFFMPPLYSFRVDAPQDIADLCIFVLQPRCARAPPGGRGVCARSAIAGTIFVQPHSRGIVGS
jgi:two-component system, OmpR family, sensor histidine kinase KdpD